MLYQHLLPDLLACCQLHGAHATAESSLTFSKMWCLKTQLQSSMGDSRLNNLALIAVERELSDQLIQTPEKIIDDSAN
jgi:hypothetical protein